MSTERDRRRVRKEIRKERHKALKKDLCVRKKVDHQLREAGVGARVEAVKRGLGRPGVAEAISKAMLEHEGAKGPIKDYDTLRAVVSTALSLQGFDLRDVMLKFTWDGKTLHVYAGPSLDAVKAAAKVTGVDEEDAFRGMLQK
jgi:hypothetical protein